MAGQSRPALGSAQVVQVGRQDQVLLTGGEVNNGRELAGDTNLGAHRGKIGGQFVSGDVRTLRSAVIRVDRICTIVVLPAPLGPSSANTVP